MDYITQEHLDAIDDVMADTDRFIDEAPQQNRLGLLEQQERLAEIHQFLRVRMGSLIDPNKYI